MQEKSITGPVAVHTSKVWLQSGHFPSYNTDVTLTVKDVVVVDNPQFGAVKEDSCVALVFEQTPLRLRVRRHHEKALGKRFGSKLAEDWRGSIALYCVEDAVKTDELYDQVRIRQYEPKPKQQDAPKLTEGNPGGGSGRLGDPP